MNGIEKFIFGLAVGLFLGWWSCWLAAPRPQASVVVEERRDTVVRIDTLRVVEPRVVERAVVRIVRDTLLLASGEPAEVEVPIEQAHYADSLCEAWVSGYRPSLDSIRIYAPTRTIEVERVVAAKPRRWSVGVQAGAGFTPKGFQPYFGVGVAYRIF